MKKSSVHITLLMWCLTFLMAAFVAGCGGSSRDPILGSGFSADTSAPTVTAVTPDKGATAVAVNAKISATFSKDMDPASINANTFKLTGPGATAVAGTVAYDPATHVATFTPTVPATLATGTQFTATITTGAKALGGQALAADYVWTFTTVATAPRVVSTVPADRATNVAINTRISATFSKDMDPATLTAATFTLTGPGAPTVTGTVAYTAAARTATFTPTAPATLTAQTDYTATIKAGARDTGGTALAADYVWTFKTGSTASTAPPTVTSVGPTANATGVCLQKIVTATFSQPMDPATITTASFTLQFSGPPLGAALPATVSYDAANQVASLTPSAALAPNTSYTATITTAATDLTGNALAANMVWSFTTGTASCAPPVAAANLLGSAAAFGVFGGSAGTTNQGILTVVNGDIGTVATATSSITGFHDSAPSDIYTETNSNKGNVTGKILTCAVSTTGPTSAAVNPVSCTRATNALADARAAYNALKALPAGADPSTTGGNLAGLTLAPGTYTSAAGSFRIQGADLTLDAQGDANAVFVFQMASTLTVGGPGAAAPQSIILKNGALAKNIYWQVGSAATINAAGGGSMAGTILSQQGVTFSTAGTPPTAILNGRALSLNASVTLVDTVINVPAP